MRAKFCWFIPAAIVSIFIIFIACQSGEAKGKQLSPSNSGRTRSAMQTYYMGRFSISVPEGFKFMCRDTTFRGCEIREFIWPEGNRDQARLKIWNDRISEIKSLRKPKGIKDIIIEEKMPGIKNWSKAIYYYWNEIALDEGCWDILVDFGSVGIWIKYDGLLGGKVKIYNWVLDVIKAYRALPPEVPSHLPPGNWFYTKYGAINMPYYAQESSELNLYNEKLDLNLEIKTNEIHREEPEGHGLIGRVAAAIITGYGGIKIKRLRSQKREISGFKGEEEVDGIADSSEKNVDFGWRYAGKVDSGEYPEICIRIATTSDDLDEKFKIWDAVLDSFKPMYKTSK